MLMGYVTMLKPKLGAVHVLCVLSLFIPQAWGSTLASPSTSEHVIIKNTHRQTHPGVGFLEQVRPRWTDENQQGAARSKEVQESRCRVELRGNEVDEVEVAIACGGSGIASNKFNYKEHPEKAPDMEQFGFRLFASVDGIPYAIVVSPDVHLIISHVEIDSLSDLGAVFLVKNAELTIEKGFISNIQEGMITGVMNVRSSVVHISNVECTETSGKRTGVLVMEESKVDISNCVFKGNIGRERSLLFFVYDNSKLDIVDSHMSGPLPHSEVEPENRMRDLSVSLNFKDTAAEAGVAFVSGESVVVAKMTFMEHYPSIKGMIYLEGNSEFQCDDCKLYNNLALYGGAIHSQNSVVKLKDVHAHKNSASRGGAVLLHGNSSCVLEDVYFEHNVAIQGGGLYLELQGESEKERVVVSLKDCRFERNAATSAGGGIYSQCVSLDLQGCRFVDNLADTEGGAVFANSSAFTSFDDVNFVANTASNGGAVSVHAEDTHGNMSLHKAVFSSNRAKDGDGGAVWFTGSSSRINISLCQFVSNTAARSGGAVYGLRAWTVLVDGVLFSGSAARNDSGGSLYLWNSTEVMVNNTVFTNGMAGRHGGEVVIDQSIAVALESLSFHHSTAQKDGGALALSTVGLLSIVNSTIIGCKAGRSGGGISFKEPMERKGNATLKVPRVRLADTRLEENEAKEGGAIYAVSIDVLALENCRIDDNKAGSGGGIFASNMSSLTLKNVSANGNSASKKGGVLQASVMDAISITSSRLANNTAVTLGGACHTTQIPKIIVKGVIFLGNIVKSGSGGALALLNVSEIEVVSKSVFRGNEARESGGGIFINKPRHTTISDTDFVHNKAIGGHGGGIYFLPDGNGSTHLQPSALKDVHLLTHEEEEPSGLAEAVVRFTTVNFHVNEAGEDGGALYLHNVGGGIRMEKTYFEDCRAMNGRGGCASITDAASLEVLVGDFEKNIAAQHGGCLFLVHVPTVSIDKAKFDACRSDHGKGGALYLEGDGSNSTTLFARDGVLTANRAGYGGGYYITKVRRALFDESKFYENHATSGSGGAMDIVNVTTVQMMDLRMDKNEASLSCGGFCLTTVEHAVISGVYTSNKALGFDGGAGNIRRVRYTMVRGVFTNNEAQHYGGALQLSNCESMKVQKVKFSSNIARLFDGGALSVRLVTTLSVLDSNFTRNSARAGGGLSLIKQNSTTVSVVDVLRSRFIENRVRGNGGGLVVAQGPQEANSKDKKDKTASIVVDVNSTLFKDNRAKNGGGAAVLAGEVHFQGSNFTGNDADGRGGGLYFDNAFFLIILNASIIERNTAHKGGALHVSCRTNVNFTYALVRHNSAHRRDDGGLVTCDEHSVYIANVTFVHNFRDHEWYWYIIFTVGGYGVLFFFFGLSYYLFRKRFRFRNRKSIVVYNYSDIGEYDPEASDLAFFADPPDSLSEDEPIIPPKPSPSMLPEEPGYRGDFQKDPLHVHEEESEIKEGSLDDLPLPQSKHPEYV